MLIFTAVGPIEVGVLSRRQHTQSLDTGSFWYISGILNVIMLAELFVCFLGMDQENRHFNLFQSVSDMCKMTVCTSF